MTTQVDPPAGTPARGARPTGRAALVPVLRRLHFLSGFLAAPLILSMALTGILFAWYPQIDTLRFGDTFSSVAPDAAPVPLSEQVRAAVQAKPRYAVTAVTPSAPEAYGGRETTAVYMQLPEGAAASGQAPEKRRS